MNLQHHYALARPSADLVRLASLGLLETKEDDDVDIKGALEQVAKAQDDRFKGMERIIDALAAEMRRSPLGGDQQRSIRDPNEVKAWDDYLRRDVKSGIEQFAQKSLVAGSNPDGGFTIPDQWAARIVEAQFLTSPMRSICNVETVSTSRLDMLVDKDEPGAVWVGEVTARPETATPTWETLGIGVFEMYAMPKASQTVLDDSRVNLEEWLTAKVAAKFGRKETTAFVSGNGVIEPKGFLSETLVANGSWAWGKIGYVVTGQSGAFASSNPADALISLKFALKAPYRAGAVWLMNSTTASVVEKFKDSTGRYLWASSLSQDAPDRLLGFPVVIAEDMPDIAADSHSIAFGNFREGYTIVDRAGISMLRDPYSAKPHVLFYTRKRVGGGVTNFEAIKTLKFGTA